MDEETIDDDTLRSRYSAVLAEKRSLAATVESLKKAYDKLLFDYELLKRQTIGPKADRVRHAEAQLPLLELLAALGRLQQGDESAAADAQAALDAAQDAMAGPSPKPPRPPRALHGRRKLALEDLPLRRLVIEPMERFAPGGDLLEKVGEESTTLIERTPASMVRLEVVRPKYKLPDMAVVEALEAAAPTATRTSSVPLGAPLGRAPLPGRIVIADMPERVIPRSMAEPGLLAHILVSKFADHLPLHRQEGIYKREGFRIARSTLGEWVGATTNLLSHVFDAMWQDARDNATYSIVDATGVLVQAKDECRRAHFYVVVVPQEHVLFRFTKKNDGPTVAALLADFRGHIHADAATVYHELYRRQLGHLVEVGCWAHARRKFFDALSRDRERALTGIGYISHLYDAHRAALDEKTGVADTAARAAAARPILARLLRWARREFRKVEEGTPIHIALGYLVRQRRALLRFLDNGRLRLDTNPAELALRHEVVGRKNWLFVGSDDGARWNTIAVSLIASCQLHDIEPWAYLRDVLTLLPTWPQQRVLELSPKHWLATQAKPETQDRLAELRLFDRATPVDPVAGIAAVDA
jgi:transposase